MSKNKVRSEIIVHPKGWKTLLRCVVLADNQADALRIVQISQPEDHIDEKSIIRWFRYPSPEQLNLF